MEAVTSPVGTPSGLDSPLSPGGGEASAGAGGIFAGLLAAMALGWAGQQEATPTDGQTLPGMGDGRGKDLPPGAATLAALMTGLTEGAGEPGAAPDASGAPDTANPQGAAAILQQMLGTDAAPVGLKAGADRPPFGIGPKGSEVTALLATRDASSLTDPPVSAGSAAPSLPPALSLTLMDGQGATAEELLMPVTDAALASPAAAGLATAGGVTGQAAASSALSASIGSERWGGELAERITWLASGENATPPGQARTASASLALNPPDLGPLEVRIDIVGDKAHVQFASSHAAVREAVEAALPLLREALSGQGIQLAQANVSDQGLANPGGQQQNHPDPSPPADGRAATAAAETGEPPLSSLAFIEGRGLVNLFA